MAVESQHPGKIVVFVGHRTRRKGRDGDKGAVNVGQKNAKDVKGIT